MENKYVYCILCGAENNPQAKFCTKCGQPMEQKDDDIVTYVTEKVKGEIKNNITDKAQNAFLALLEKFVNSYLYGIVLSISIVMAATTVFAGGGSSDITEFNNSNLLYEPNMEVIRVDTDLMRLGINYYYGVAYDENQNIIGSYVCENWPGMYDYSRYQVRIYDENDNLIADEADMDEQMGCIPLKNLNCRVEIFEPYMDYIQRTVTTFYPTGEVESQATYDGEGDMHLEVYFKSGARKEISNTVKTDSGDIKFDSDTYNENGDLVGMYSEINGKPDRRREIVYGDNYEYTYIYDYDESGAEFMTNQYVIEYDENGREIKRGWLNADGTPDEVSYMTYYDSGAMKTSDSYNGEILTHHTEYAEDGSKSVYYYADGKVYNIIYYDANGGFIKEEKIN